MSVKIHPNFRFIKKIQETYKLICSSHRGINFMFIVFYFNMRSFEL